MLAEQVDFHKMYKITPTAMALVPSDLTVIDVNEEFEGYAGRPQEDVVGRNIFEVMPKVPPDPGGDPVWSRWRRR
jgi:PAS domain S-box-containing protein